MATGARTPAAAVAALLRAPLHLALGRLDDAEEAARTGVGADGGPHVPLLAPQAWLVLAHAALRRGALARAEDHLRTLDQGFPQHASSPWSAARDLLSAQLAEARTDARAAADVLAEIGERPGGLRELVLVDPAAAAWCVRCALAADLPGLVKTVVDTVDQLQAHNPCSRRTTPASPRCSPRRRTPAPSPGRTRRVWTARACCTAIRGPAPRWPRTTPVCCSTAASTSARSASWTGR
ncbi:hypothetical protein SSCG_05852 [Streptomyces clavuligerus]|nr:hypothetical protein SSCG_05852 [Streptomyces clavuligerus]